MASILTIMATTSSCHHVNHIIRSGTREFRLESTIYQAPCVFSGKVASVVAEVGSLFPRLRASICKSGRQKVHRTVERELDFT